MRMCENPLTMPENPAISCLTNTGSGARIPLGKRTYLIFKRLMDLVLSSISLLLLSPVFLVTAIAIKLDSKGSVFYSQVRIGKRRQPFVMYKFRSMCEDADTRQKKLCALNERDGPAFKIGKDPRVTLVGRFLRKTCIDELPQLINVMKGDMSIVGPRPPRPCEVENYSPYHFRRLEATPGLTCYWQISDRDMAFDQWVEMDIEYITKSSALLDIRLIIRTIATLPFLKGDR